MTNPNQLTESQSIAQLAIHPNVMDLLGVPHLVYPNHVQRESLEHLLPAPIRVRGLYNFEAPQSFARYIEEFKEDGTRVFADFDKYRFLSVINGSLKDQPAHSDHRVTLNMTTTQEWKAWVEKNGKRMGPREFALFLENHIREITGEFSGTDLLAMCRGLRTYIKGGMTADENVSEGKRSLSFAMNTQVAGQRPSGQEVAFPETIQITLKVFNHFNAYVFEPRLRWDADDKGIVFWYDLIDPVTVQRAAFEQAVTEVNQATNLQAFIGWLAAGQ